MSVGERPTSCDKTEAHTDFVASIADRLHHVAGFRIGRDVGVEVDVLDEFDE